MLRVTWKSGRAQSPDLSSFLSGEALSQMTGTASGVGYDNGQCRKCHQEIIRLPGRHWRHPHNKAERCAPGTRNASLADPIPRSVRHVTI